MTTYLSFIRATVLAVLLCPQQSFAWSPPTPTDIAHMTAAAEKGNPQAQSELGDAYYFGFTVKIDDRKAIEWWKKAADQNYSHAEFRLGEAYGDDGSGDGTGHIHLNGAVAMQWLERAVKHGDPLAKCALGQAYEMAYNGVSQDHTKAMRLFSECVAPTRVLALLGDPHAELVLALAYDKGWGVEADKAQAFKWRMKSAEQGFPGGEAYVALCYYSGAGVEKNLAESVRWMKDAADKGESLAQLWLGAFYAKGEGVPKDTVKAYMWFDIALAQGMKEAGGAMVEVSKSMTPDQLTEATKLSHVWQSEHLAPR
jgi:TPR repeat protein